LSARLQPSAPNCRARNEPLHVGRLAQPQQVRHAAALQLQQHRLVAVARVAARQRRATLGTQLIEQPSQRRPRVPAGVLLARAHLHIEHQPQVAHPEGVQHVAGAHRLGRVVADLGTFLAPVQRLDARVDVQHPGPIQRFAHRMHQRRAQPRAAGRIIDALQRPAQRVLAHDTPHAQHLRGHRIASERRDVRVAAVPRQQPQHQRAQHIALGGRVVARVLERATLDPPLEHPRGRQELGEIHQLTVRRGRSLPVPAHVHAPAQRVDHLRRLVNPPGPNQPRFALAFALTHRVVRRETGKE